LLPPLRTGTKRQRSHKGDLSVRLSAWPLVPFGQHEGTLLQGCVLP
jgi:hypothetical protein